MTVGEVEQVTIIVNGEPRVLPSTAVVDDLAGDGGARNVAVARNGELVPRGQWKETMLKEGDRVEIVGPVRGG